MHPSRVRIQSLLLAATLIVATFVFLRPSGFAAIDLQIKNLEELSP